MLVFLDMWDYLTDGSSWTGSGGMLQLMVEQLLLTGTAMLVACATALPLALWLGHRRQFGFLAVNISNVGRAVPTCAVLVLLALGPVGNATFGPYGRAGAATLIALTLFALPPIVTNAYVAVSEVPAPVREAARGMGMGEWQLFRQVELPLALPLMVSGLRLALVQVWATATIAALVAGPGLGRVITDGFFNTQYGKGLAGALVVALVALALELASSRVQRLATPRGVRGGAAS